MTNADYRGARAANAGDDYHELWALRQVLSLLDTKSGLYAVAVEGLKIEDESGKLPDTHPGEILLEEFLRPLGISQVVFARHVDVPLQRIHSIVRGKRGITPDTVWRFAQAFGATPEFWMNLQSIHDLASSRPPRMVERINPITG